MSNSSHLVRDETTARAGFWQKARKTLGQVPFTEDAVAAFYCATDSAFTAARMHITQVHREQARAWLLKEQAARQV